MESFGESVFPAHWTQNFKLGRTWKMFDQPLGKMALEHERDPDHGPASDQVLALPEILENILLYLPMGDVLLNAQRVARCWKDTINCSTKLQQALFLIPLTPETNSLSFRAWRSHNAHFDFRDPDTEADATVEWFQHAEIAVNPMFPHLGRLSRAVWASSRIEPKYTHKEATWRRMLITQPPVAFSMDRSSVVSFQDLLSMRAPDIWLAEIVNCTTTKRTPFCGREVASMASRRTRLGMREPERS